MYEELIDTYVHEGYPVDQAREMAEFEVKLQMIEDGEFE